MKRNRIIYIMSAILVILVGLMFKKNSIIFPEAIRNIIGDSLWALMVFFSFGFLFINLSTIGIAFFSTAFSFIIEFSQIYHSAWIDSIRANKLGGLILGNTFSIWDLPCYLLGIFAGMLIETLLKKWMFYSNDSIH